jgi:hypothetical protein
MQFKLSVSLVSILALGSTFLLLTPDSMKGQTVSRPELLSLDIFDDDRFQRIATQSPNTSS